MKIVAKIMALSMILVLMLTSYSFALNYTKIEPSTVSTNTAQGQEMVSKVKTLIGTLQFIGYAIAVGMLIYIGIKYIMASANEKADLKSSLVKYVIGAVLIAGGVTIASWIFNALA